MTRAKKQQRDHVEQIVNHTHSYKIRVGGTMDGVNTRDPVGYTAYGQAWENNVSVRLENVGSEVVHSPWLVVNGKRQWRSLEEIVAEVLPSGLTDAQKARRLWEFARRHRYHYTTGDDEVKDTVKMLNVYGYTLCWDEAYTMSNLWQAAGLQIRRGVPHGHCTTEAFYDGAFHLLDSDEHLLYLLRDNRTVACEEDLARDHDLVRRGHAYGILAQEDAKTGELAAALFVHSGPRGGGRPMLTRHCMDLDLRPGEAIEWEWADRGKYHGHGERPPRLCNGRMCLAPRLDASFATWAEQTAHLRSDGRGLTPEAADREALLQYRICAPYVCVGGRLRGAAGWQPEISFDGADWTPIVGGDLDAHFPPAGPARYGYHVRLRAAGVRLDGLSIETDLQMAPLSLPALEVGDNQVRYFDATQGPRQVRVTHTWAERDDVRPPAAPAYTHHPGSGARADASRLDFSWEAIPGAADYEFRLSEHKDMRQTLSPVFEKLISRTPAPGQARWRVPRPGLLTPGQSYYWQVRARSSAGLWGPWGPIWRFTVDGPGVPLDLRLEADYAQYTLTLHWTPNPVGNPADHFEVYGSDERGFAVNRTAYQRQEGQDGTESTCPSNLLGATTGTCLQVAGPSLRDPSANRAHYRVMAVDGRGRCSGESEYVTAPLPFVYSPPPAQAVAGQQTAWTFRSLRSEGDLRCVSQGSHRYLAAFRDADALKFLLDEGPEFLELDEASGVMTARPGPEHLGFHTVTVRVQRQQGGEAVQGFDLEVVSQG